MATGVLNLHISGLEDNIMRHMDRYISSLFLAAAIAAPTAIMADPRPVRPSALGDMRRLTIKIY